jgi:MYXO-CTERM domain-containing protein
VDVTGDYVGPTADQYGIHPIQFVAVATSGGDSGGSGCSTVNYAAVTLMLVVVFVLLRRRGSVRN